MPSKNFRAETLYFEFKSVFELIEENVSYIEAGVIKKGTVVYCSKILQDVVFLEGPSPEIISKYHKDLLRNGIAPLPANIKYETFNGEVRECPVACIAKISSGSSFSSYEVCNDEGAIEENLGFLARANGFRVEQRKSEKGHIFTFYGDSQETVDQFVDYIKDSLN